MSETTNTQASKDVQVAKGSTHGGGLEDAVAADSSVCFIDGYRSRLIYRGYSIEDLAAHSTFEEVAYLLYFKKLPTKSELKDFSEKLAQERTLSGKFVERMNGIPPKAHPMSVLRTLVSTLSFYDEEAEDASYDSVLRKAIRMTAQLPSMVAAWERVRNGKKPVEPNKKLSHAANFLYMLTGKEAEPYFARAVDLYLVLLADHEFNASTFAARITCSTLSDYYSVITSAIGTLKGPLHGGANEKVIQMLLEIKEPANVDGFIRDAFAKKKKVMGFGHRVYKVLDPRSPILKETSKKICQMTGNENLFKMSERIEELVTTEKKLPSNVDFYSATVLYCAGIPAELFTPMFLMSRIAGYNAHTLEQVADNRLIRPRANYTGQMDVPYKTIDKR